MQVTKLGPFDQVSRLILGGGGLGQVWGETSPKEAIATIGAALDAGINMIDTAPMYHNCEKVINEAFNGNLPDGLRITTKCQLGEPPAGETAGRLEASLDATFTAMKIDYVDAFILHSNICEDDAVFARHNDQRAAFATPWSLYVEEVIPTMERLIEQGRIGTWGITGIGVPSTILKALQYKIKPGVVQVITNLLDSPGGIRRFSEPPIPRKILLEANKQGVGVMGIRAVQAGALTSAIDRETSPNHPETKDFERAAPYRALCAELGVDPAQLAHQYALDMKGANTVVLGVKNRDELAQCLQAEADGPLSDELRARIDDCVKQ